MGTPQGPYHVRVDTHFKDEIKQSGIAVICAHPDDAELGAGGLLALKGGIIISLTDGSNHTRDSEAARFEAGEASVILGVEHYLREHTPEMPLVTRDLVGWIDLILDKNKIDTVVTHHPQDGNQEHVLASQAAIAAARRLDNLIFMEPIPCSGRIYFKPQLYIDITDVTDKKYKAVGQYRSQIISKGRSLVDTRLKLDAWRGCELGVEYAEAFEVRRWKL